MINSIITAPVEEDNEGIHFFQALPAKDNNEGIHFGKSHDNEVDGVKVLEMELQLERQFKRNAGTNALIVLRDTRWTDDRSIIGTMEVDLSEESNLLITRGLIGRLTNTSHAGFRYNIQNVADYLASTGINAVPATPRTTAELQGMRWILQPPNTPQIRNPQSVRTTTLLDGSISLAFSGYRSIGNPRPSNYNKDDVEDIHEEEFAGVFFHEYELGTPDTNDRWDTLGEPTGRYNFYVNYAAPPPAPFIPPTKPCWDDDDDNEDNNEEEVVCPSIWEDTPWEDDPEFDPNDLAEEGSDANEPVVVQHVEQIEAQLPIQNGWHNPIPLDYSLEEFIDRIPEGMAEGNWYEVYENPEQDENEIYNVPEQINNEVTNISDNISALNLQQEQEHMQEHEVAHVNTEHLEYPMFRQLEKALASTSESAISNYKQPNEPLMGQINYPPTQGTTPQFNDNGQFKGRFKVRLAPLSTRVKGKACDADAVLGIKVNREEERGKLVFSLLGH
ncbi:hypothetical protein ZIOFF_045523 [Zingiber officinale]|uniref:Uncharacterized protein n=1 Tax=Zingiber officinale TaxID=94328 RepID=A0A8J5KVC6_ZINOF|nr:hypothetical protein ZIOFF_045523 [Zingiber officinale]